MGLVLKHVIRTKAGTWHYRRRMPRDVSGPAGQKEFKRLLGISEREALRNFPKVHAEFEQAVSEARRRVAGEPARVARTALDDWRDAKARLAEVEAELGIGAGGAASRISTIAALLPTPCLPALESIPRLANRSAFLKRSGLLSTRCGAVAYKPRHLLPLRTLAVSI